MGFADWKKRSKACANVMTYSVPTRSNILRALQAAHKAGEREGRKQVEAIAENGAKLAVLVEREACAQLCHDAFMYLEHGTDRSDPQDDREAHMLALVDVPTQVWIDEFATRFIAAYLAEGQEPVSLYPCGFKKLHSLVIEAGAFLARNMNEDELVTSEIRSITMELVRYAKDMSGLLARQPLFAAPPEPAPQPKDETTSCGTDRRSVQAAPAAPSSEEVARMTHNVEVRGTCAASCASSPAP